MVADNIKALATLLGDKVQRDAPLGTRTTYRVGGTARLYAEIESAADLALLHSALASVGGLIPVLVVGKGSNMLVSDDGFEGLAISLGSAYSQIDVESTKLRAGAGAGFPVAARVSAKAGLTGLEWAVGVPGSVGGAVRMNAGGHGSDTAAVLGRCEIYDLVTGASVIRPAGDLDLGYRHSNLSAGQVVLWAEFSLEKGDAGRAEALLSEIVRWRRDNQPGGSNAGSVFVNPPGDSAGRIIDSLGLKGFRMGSAHVSEKHANFFQADDGGSAGDVLSLIDHVRNVVRESTGIDLSPEVRLIGFRSEYADFVAFPLTNSTGGDL